MTATHVDDEGREAEERRRIIIEGVSPEIDAGRYAVKRTVGETVVVEADLVADGHDHLAGVLRYRHEDEEEWIEVRLMPLVNDRWRAGFAVNQLGRYFYTLAAWVDHFETWRRGFAKKVQAGVDVGVDLLVGAELVRQAAGRAGAEDAGHLERWASELADRARPQAERAKLALESALADHVSAHPDRRFATTYPRELAVRVDRERARFSSWYEMFPRSTSGTPGRPGTLRDAAERLEYVASMGFDVVYLPPIHPIGRTHRKGKNNSTTADKGDPGSPWAIGSSEGGHKSIHPELGTLEDFRHFVARARELGMEVALDIAFQCSPDHPYVKEHPDWFRWRPDGSVQYAENPPKKYQDIFPFEFESDAWWSLWKELKSIFEHWIEQGVRIFRVDNPHTKPFAFWEWCLDALMHEHRDLIFLAEAFTRPKIMYALAKVGFTQSYTYFTWRNSKWELTQYFTELVQAPAREIFRPNLWPNTPDILHATLQQGGRPAFMQRLVLAATLGANYGMYGPAFELCEGTPREPGSEEYLNSEKYEIRHWDVERSDSLRDLIGRLNRIRRANPALHGNWSLQFHHVDNDQLICYSKQTAGNTVLMVVNLDTRWKQSGWLGLNLERLGIGVDETYEVHDLLTGSSYTWQGAHAYVELDPRVLPAHVFEVRRRARS